MRGRGAWFFKDAEWLSVPLHQEYLDIPLVAVEVEKETVVCSVLKNQR